MAKYYPEYVLKYFRNDWSQCDSTVIIMIAEVTLFVFNYRYYGTTLKLRRYIWMLKHDIEKDLEPFKQG